MTAETQSPTAALTAPVVTAKHRRLLIAVFAISSSMGYIAMIQIIPVILIPMATDLGTSRTAIAAASTVSTLTGALAAFPAGRVLDRYGGRAVMTSGAAIGAIAVALWAQANSLPTVYLSFVLIGFSITMCTYEAAFAVLVFATDPGHRDRAIITVAMIAGLVTYLVYPVLGWMNGEFGWRTTLLILAVAFGATAVPGHLWIIPSGAVHRRQVAHRSGVPIGTALRRSRFWLLLIAFVGQAGSVSAFLLLAVAYLVDVGHSIAAATAMLVAIGVMQILSRLVLTTFARRIRLVPATSVAFAIQALGLLLLPLAGLSIPLCVLCVAAVGVGQGIGVIARPSILADSFGVAHFASVLAAITVPMAIARAGMPLLGAWLGDWRFLMICGALALIGALALLPLVRVPPVEAAAF
ncbi:MFS transporter [Mycobacterium sp. AZCC_0083]|uniref:MFS transporter n=1 Tax=Mycobacterium sp. AZCC_0083 TaxID=2735882 RepID=UPI001608B982|nr:MFS transporter [Mycobacterium sp. AZCC_0083]MBB5161202.1 putative MFS family arabinose efflux permease [Mycobacterium sp. AZCC_0083]